MEAQSGLPRPGRTRKALERAAPTVLYVVLGVAVVGMGLGDSPLS